MISLVSLLPSHRPFLTVSPPEKREKSIPAPVGTGILPLLSVSLKTLPFSLRGTVFAEEENLGKQLGPGHMKVVCVCVRGSHYVLSVWAIKRTIIFGGL